MVEQKRLAAYIGGAVVLVLVIVGITLAIVLTGKESSDADPVTPVPQPGNSRKKMVIDHDGGADDAYAITMALLYEKYFDGPQVVALTSTYGNVHESQALFNGDRIRRLCNRQDIPLYPGSREALISGISTDFYFGNDGLGDTGYRPPSVTTDDTESAVALIELSKKYRGELIVVALGPLTNVALASRADPGFLRRINHLYVGAGHIHSNGYPDPEFNAAMDPEAYYIVTKDFSLVNVTIVPYSQVMDSLNISLDWRLNTLGRIGTQIIRELSSYERISLPKSSSWAHLDPAVMAIALDEDIVEEFRNTTNSIGLEGTHRGITTVNYSPTNAAGRTFYRANIQKYEKFLLDVYSAELYQN